MKKSGVSVALFFIAFIATYLACCYLIPGWRIKLEADTVTYFIESISHMVFIKGLIALAVGLSVGAVPMLTKKEVNTQIVQKVQETSSFCTFLCPIMNISASRLGF